MEKRPFGQNDMQVSVLGFGGSEIGLEAADEATVAHLLGKALDAGLNVIDTGECYGESENLIGKTVRQRREEFYLFTKCGHPHGMESGANWTPESILESIERTLQRLRTDRVDLVHLHSCPETVLKKATRSQLFRRRGERATLSTSATAATAMLRVTRWSAARSIRSRPRSILPTRKRLS